MRKKPTFPIGIIVLGCISPVLGQSTPPGATMYYSFDGHGQDAFGNGPKFKASGTSTITQNTGYRGGGVEIGDSGTVKALPSPLFQWTEEFSIGFMIKVPDVSRERVLIESYEEGNDKKGWTITLLKDGRVRLDGHKSVGVTTGETLGPAYNKAEGTRVAPQSWTSVLVLRRRRDPQHLDTMIFVDGKLSAVRANEDDRMLTANRPVLIGTGRRSHDKETRVSVGLKFDSLTVWDKGLTDQQVQDWFQHVKSNG